MESLSESSDYPQAHYLCINCINQNPLPTNNSPNIVDPSINRDPLDKFLTKKSLLIKRNYWFIYISKEFETGPRKLQTLYRFYHRREWRE